MLRLDLRLPSALGGVFALTLLNWNGQCFLQETLAQREALSAEILQCPQSSGSWGTLINLSQASRDEGTGAR